MNSLSAGDLPPLEAGKESDWCADFASKLIQDHFLLTALEFHAELAEAGREIPKLKEFFSNPGNFEQAVARPELSFGLPRSGSQATLDSLDLARYSEDGERAYDERVAVLEFELRKAKETISALRANLTYAAESESDKQDEADADRKRAQALHAGIKPHEQRALNFLINEYLLKQGYKLTSITFADENESQDFEDWDDVGLNLPRPQELLFLYREGLKACKANKSLDVDVTDAESQANLMDEENEALISKMNEQIEGLKNHILELEFGYMDLLQRLSAVNEQQPSKVDFPSQTSGTPEPDCFELIDDVKSRESSETKSIQSTGEWTKISDQEKPNNADIGQESVDVSAGQDGEEEVGEEDADTPLNSDSEVIVQIAPKEERTCSEITVSREIPVRFKNEALKCYDIRFPSDGDLLTEIFNDLEFSQIGVDVVVKTLAENLPKIIPNIILKEREEIIPLLVLSICLSKDSNSRDQLLSLLFNLQKRPQSDQRQHILRALLTIAKTLGPSITEEEILPQCWEQINHKYMERRLLVAESCFLLSPFISETIRNSLVLSMIQQLVEDREELIRRSSVSCLTLLVTLISVPDKFSQLCDIAMDLLLDSSPSVSQQVQTLLLPALAQWSLTLNSLQSQLYERLLTRLSRDSVIVISTLESLLPYLVMFIASSKTVQNCLGETFPPASKRQEFSNLCKGLCDPMVFYSGSVMNVVSAFDHVTANLEETFDWPELDWVMTHFLPKVFQVASENLEHPAVIRGLVSLLRHLCAGLGKNITFNLVKPELSRRLERCSAGLMNNQAEHLEMIPLYIVGVLSLGPRDGAGLEDLGGALFEYLCALPLCGAPLLPLQIAVECVSLMDALRVILLDTLWDGVVHQRPVVRGASACLIQSIIPNLPDHLIAGRVVPALVTLSGDPETSVKAAVIPSLCMLSDAQERQTRDKVTMTLQSLLQEASSTNNIPLLVQLLRSSAEFYDKFDATFRVDVILPQLASLAASCESNKNLDLLKSLTDAFSAVTYSHNQLSALQLSSSVLPGLRSLDSVARQIDLPRAERIESMLKHAERLVPMSPDSSQKSLISETSSISLSPKVEEVRNKVTKIFNARPQSLHNVSGIFKKKH